MALVTRSALLKTKAIKLSASFTRLLTTVCMQNSYDSFIVYIYTHADVDNLSPMIRGAAGPGFYVEAYETEEELKKILENYLV